MNSFKWQKGARIVAILDLIWGAIAIILLALGAFVIVANSSEPMPEIVVIACVISAISIILNIFQLYVTYKLLKSTKHEMGVSEAKSVAKFWMILTGTCVILAAVGSFFYGNWTMLATDVIIRGIFIGIVGIWIRELASVLQ